jgi:hypothetical protein
MLDGNLSRVIFQRFFQRAPASPVRPLASVTIRKPSARVIKVAGITVCNRRSDSSRRMAMVALWSSGGSPSPHYTLLCLGVRVSQRGHEFRDGFTNRTEVEVRFGRRIL